MASLLSHRMYFSFFYGGICWSVGSRHTKLGVVIIRLYLEIEFLFAYLMNSCTLQDSEVCCCVFAFVSAHRAV
jgi:hypothetical protein